MIIVDELKYLFTIALHPSDFGEKKPNLLTSTQFYYVSTFISLIILVGLTFFLPNSITQSTNILYEIILWLLLPLVALIESLIIQVVGGNFLSVFKHRLSHTYHAVILPTALIMALLWVSVLYPPLSIAIVSLIVAWSFVVMAITLSKMQDIGRVDSLVALVASYTLIYFILTVVLFILVGINLGGA